MKNGRIKNQIGTVLFVIVFLFGSYLFYSDSTIKDSELRTFKGTISDLGTTAHSTSTSRGARTSDVFFIQIDGLDETLATYNVRQKYNHLQNALNIGDTVKVMFKTSTEKDQPNINLYELEHDAKIIIKQSTYRTKMLIQSIVCFLVSIITIYIGARKDKRLKEETSKYMNLR